MSKKHATSKDACGFTFVCHCCRNVRDEVHSSAFVHLNVPRTRPILLRVDTTTRLTLGTTLLYCYASKNKSNDARFTIEWSYY